MRTHTYKPNTPNAWDKQEFRDRLACNSMNLRSWDRGLLQSLGQSGQVGRNSHENKSKSSIKKNHKRVLYNPQAPKSSISFLYRRHFVNSLLTFYYWLSIYWILEIIFKYCWEKYQQILTLNILLFFFFLRWTLLWTIFVAWKQVHIIDKDYLKFI